MYYEGDVCDASLISRIYSQHCPDHICHLAARAGVRPSIVDPFIYIHSNIEATVRLLEFAGKYGCKHFVYASSSSVYGGSDKAVFSEADSVDCPVSPYAATKKACELMAHVYHSLHGYSTAGLRFFTVYGPRGRPDMAPYKFIDGIARGNPIQKFGDGSSSRDYTYIDDIVDGVVRAIDRPRGCQVYNLGNRRPLTLNKFISTIEHAVGRKAVIVQLPEQPGDVPHTCADTVKAEEMLGYRPKVRFEEGIRRTADWYMGAVREGLLPPLPVVEKSLEDDVGAIGDVATNELAVSAAINSSETESLSSSSSSSSTSPCYLDMTVGNLKEKDSREAHQHAITPSSSFSSSPSVINNKDNVLKYDKNTPCTPPPPNCHSTLHHVLTVSPRGLCARRPRSATEAALAVCMSSSSSTTTEAPSPSCSSRGGGGGLHHQHQAPALTSRSLSTPSPSNNYPLHDDKGFLSSGPCSQSVDGDTINTVRTSRRDVQPPACGVGCFEGITLIDIDEAIGLDLSRPPSPLPPPVMREA